MSIVGRLRALLSLESSQFIADAGKVQGTTRELQSGFGALAVKVKGLGPSLAGAQQATAATGQALKLMGVEGSSAVQGLGNALSGLISSGFTAWGIAIAGATGLLGTLWAVMGDDGESASEKAAAALKTVQDRSEGLRKELVRLKDQLRAATSGKDVETVTSEREIGEVQRELDGLVGSYRKLGEEKRALERLIPTLPQDETLPEDVRLLVVKKAIDELIPRMAALSRERDLLAAKEGTRTAIEVVKEDAVGAAAALKALEANLASVRAAVSGESAKVVEGVANPELADRLRDARQWAEGLARIREEALDAEPVVRALHESFEELQQALLGESAAVSPEGNAVIARAKKVAEEILRTQRDLAFDIEQFDRDETERQVAEHRRRYEALLEEAEKYGIDAARLRALIDAKAVKLSTPTRGEDRGFAATIRELADMKRGMEAVGAAAAYNLTGGLAGALEEVARGSATASEAFRQFAQSFFFDLARMVNQMLIAKAIVGMFPALGAAPAAGGEAAGAATAAATGAHGGTWKVGGFGGLDSQLVRMKLSPGELVKVTNGANSAGAGEKIDLTVVNRPAPIYADEVAARMSRRAAAGVVATAMRRAGHRGARARD